jgi:hypothetical protein
MVSSGMLRRVVFTRATRRNIPEDTSLYNTVCILTIYRSRKGNFKNFLKQLDLIMHNLHNHRYNIIICGDVNVNNLSDNRDKSQLNMVLHSYNLSSIVKFPTRFGLNSCTTIDNIFIDISSLGNYELYPLINDLFDHEAQLLETYKIHKQANKIILILKENKQL